MNGELTHYPVYEKHDPTGNEMVQVVSDKKLSFDFSDFNLQIPEWDSSGNRKVHNGKPFYPDRIDYSE